MSRSASEGRITTRLNEEEQAILRRARSVTGKTTSGVIKTALRAYAKTLPSEAPLAIFERCGVVGAISGPTDLSETYKQQITYTGKHDDPSRDE